MNSENIHGVKLAGKPMFFELDIKEPPPILRLLINPNTFSKTFTKRVAQSRTRPSTRDKGAYIYNHDIDELDVLSCSGRTAMFYWNTGLTMDRRRDSLGFRNFRSLVEIYRNNGRNYNDRPKNSAPMVTGGTGLIKTVGRVIIAYDDVIYKGSFDSFSVEENDTSPYNFTFDFSFTVSNTNDVRNA